MATLVDTNVLLRSLNPKDPQYTAAANVIASLRLRNEPLCVGPQNIIEFWAVATRPIALNGLGMTTAEAASEIASIRRLFRVLPHTPDVLEEWQGIVTRHSVLGKQTHDAHLVALMRLNNVNTILTFNGADFRRFDGITVLDPAVVSAS
jgi:predicted nucleic acid-binding protein